jgi:hypothetical protein
MIAMPPAAAVPVKKVCTGKRFLPKPPKQKGAWQPKKEIADIKIPAPKP